MMFRHAECILILSSRVSPFHHNGAAGAFADTLRYTPGTASATGRCSLRKVLFIFSVLSDADVEWLAKVGEHTHVDAGTVLIPLRSRVDYLYSVLDGRLAIRTRAGEPIAMLESGEIIGEMSLVDPAPTTVSVEVA